MLKYRCNRCGAGWNVGTELCGFCEASPSINRVCSNMTGNIILIDPSKPFDMEFISGLDGSCRICEQDEQSLALEKVDIGKISLETMLRHNEVSIDGEKRLSRLKNTDYTRLDIRFLQLFYQNLSLTPNLWKENINGEPVFIFLDGTIFLRYGNRSSFCFYWSNGQWKWNCYWLSTGIGFTFKSAVLK